MRVVLGLQYNGSEYHGWQIQPGMRTVQATVESAISKVANHEVQIYCAGRTDVGVHAYEQIVHFDTSAERKPDNWVLGINSNLPRDISILWAKEAAEDFHARFSAIARRYLYIIYNHKVRPAILHNHLTWHIHDLNADLMHEAGQYLIGEHDFSSFRGCDCQSRTPMRNVQYLSVQRKGKMVSINIKANAFLHHMVRNIAGVLMAIGEGKYSPIWAQEVLQKCDRRVASVTAPSNGLYLAKVYYPG